VCYRKEWKRYLRECFKGVLIDNCEQRRAYKGYLSDNQQMHLFLCNKLVSGTEQNPSRSEPDLSITYEIGSTPTGSIKMKFNIHGVLLNF
jgi:hypothetical protein